MLIASAMHSAVLTGAPMSAKEQVQGVTKLLLNRTFIFVQGENIDLKLVHVIKNIDYVHTTEYVSCQSLIICRAARVWYFLCMNFCCKYVQMTPKISRHLLTCHWMYPMNGFSSIYIST